MFRYAYRQLRFEHVRSFTTCFGIGAVLAVILVLEGFEQGVYAQMRAVVHARGADLIATQAGVSNMSAVRSVIPQLARAEIEAVPGVRMAHPLTGLSLIYEHPARRSAVFLLVYDTAGGPTNLVKGRPIDGDRQIVIDDSLARLYGFRPGHDLVISGFSFEIVGITNGNAVLFTPLAFTTFDTLIEFYFESDLAADLSAFPLVSYLLISLEPDTAPVAAAKAIEAAVPDVDVFSPAQLAANDEAFGRSMFGAILRTLTGVAYLCGMLVVGLFAYAAASARRRDLGVLKALGFPNRSLALGVLIETAVLSAIAIPVGLGLAQAGAGVIEALAPAYLVLPTEAGPVARTLIAACLFAVLGALVPVRFINRLEPALVFRA